MFTVFNILIIAIVLLIAYWWANQGLFSAILHLVCVIVAGAIALAVWEPLTVGLLLRGSFFDDFAWGAALIGVFAVTLLVLRVVMDKLVPGNVALPQWMNLGVGFAVGGASGILTIGIFIIGIGFIQSSHQIMGFKGMARGRGGAIEHENKLWLPVHRMTGEFYSFISAGSLYPTFNNTPLRQYNPDLHYQATLVRDSAPVKNIEGRGKLTLRPNEARIEEFIWDPQTTRYVLKVRFLSGARDFGEQLTLSGAQIRLIGSAREFAKPKVVFPDQWTQYDGLHRFDDRSHYITSQPAQSEATVLIEFPGSAFGNVHPRFVQIRNTRYRLPAPREGVVSEARSTPIATGERATIDVSAPDIQSFLQISNNINPVVASTNQKPAGIQVNDDKFITGGEGEFATSTGDRPSRSLIIQGIYEPDGTRIVQVDISRESSATPFGMPVEHAGQDAKILLVDSAGRTYRPIGFIHSKPGNFTTIKVDFQRYLPTMRDLPSLPTAGGQPLRLLFCVTEGATVAGLKLGEVTIGTCSLLVTPNRQSAPPPPPSSPTAGSKPDDL
jgi:hypothetical protein